jgi:hypothetical protein
MATEIIKNQTPEERELEKKQAELSSLEAELIQRELDLATLRAELADFESRYLRTVGILYAAGLKMLRQTLPNCLVYP